MGRGGCAGAPRGRACGGVRQARPSGRRGRRAQRDHPARAYVCVHLRYAAVIHAYVRRAQIGQHYCQILNHLTNIIRSGLKMYKFSNDSYPMCVPSLARDLSRSIHLLYLLSELISPFLGYGLACTSSPPATAARHYTLYSNNDMHAVKLAS